MKISNEKGVKLMSVPRLLVKVSSETPLPGSRDRRLNGVSELASKLLKELLQEFLLLLARDSKLLLVSYCGSNFSNS